MKKVTFTPARWRQLAITYGPRNKMIDIMRNRFGLVRLTPQFAGEPIEYEIIDDTKYLLFLITWP